MTRISVTVASILLIIIFGVYYFSNGKQLFERGGDDSSATSTFKIPTLREVPEGWLEYKNDAYSLSLLYPNDLIVSERDEGEGAMTITFQNPQRGVGFQIFVLPYSLPQISNERFKADIPSGIRKGLVEITIDGATGASFYSTDMVLGETREIWFISEGKLYEITTLRALDSWIDEIIKTWKFI